MPHSSGAVTIQCVVETKADRTVAERDTKQRGGETPMTTFFLELVK
jgi:hypothetical protein